MNKFIYEEILVKVKKFEWRKVMYDDFLELLSIAGEDGWELVGEIKGRIILKKKLG